jgi:phosphonopyruvate decarboxylase
MINPENFVSACLNQGYTLYTGTPCSYLKPLINYVIESPKLDFVSATNEGDAVAIAAGAALGGVKSVVMFQNSGLGNAVNPLTSLCHTMRIPFLGIVTLRGDPEAEHNPKLKDEPQHFLMGQITSQLLELMDIPWAFFPTENEQIEAALAATEVSMREKSLPFFFVMKKDSVQKYELSKTASTTASSKVIPAALTAATEGTKSRVKKYCSKETAAPSLGRTEALVAIRKLASPGDLLLATTGKTGRELFEIEDTDNQFYMVGSMGCALPIGIGIAKSAYRGKIFVLDGDGALLMRMGNLALSGFVNAQNIIHILLDNGMHDSTGGQKTRSEEIDFAEIALNCQYQKSYEVDSVEGLSQAMAEIAPPAAPGALSFIRFFIKAGSPGELGRPTLTPEAMATRFKHFIQRNIHETNRNHSANSNHN